MASFRKRGKVWYYRFVNADGGLVERKGCPDRRGTEELARAAEAEAAKIRAGVLDPKTLAYLEHNTTPLAKHLDDFEANLLARNDTAKHAKLHTDRARRLAALVCGGKLAEFDPPKTASAAERTRMLGVRDERLAAGRLSSLTLSKVQDALGALRRAGRSLQTLNHHRAAVRSFVLWARKDGRLRDDPLVGLSGYNVEEDRRHDRRTLSVEELRLLIEATHAAPSHREMTGPARALCYRVAVASGLRYSELGSITPQGLHLDPERPTVTIRAAYAKNGQTQTLPLPCDLVDDLRQFTEGSPSGRALFPLPPGGGAAMLREDLERAEIPYRDESGRYFDFHALRCQCATLADQAGVSPGVVQRLMRHATPGMTSRYTRPRLHDLERAAASLPSLRPTEAEPISNRRAHHLPKTGDGEGRIESHAVASMPKHALASDRLNPLALTALDASRRTLPHAVASDRAGTRTQDQRINVPHPTVHKADQTTDLENEHQPPAQHLPIDTRQRQGEPSRLVICEKCGNRIKVA